MISPRNHALISAKKNEYYFVPLYRKAKNPITAIRPEGDSVMYLPISSDPKSKKEVYHDSSSAMSSWDSDVSISDIFRSLSVNMVSTSPFEDDGEDTCESEEFLQSGSDL